MLQTNVVDMVFLFKNILGDLFLDKSDCDKILTVLTNKGNKRLAGEIHMNMEDVALEWDQRGTKGSDVAVGKNDKTNETFV